MNISSNTLKYYGIPAAVLLVVILLVLFFPISRTPSPPTETPTPSPAGSIVLPTKIYLSPTPGPSPTLVPAQPFTGAEENPQLPPQVVDLGTQKTTLRRSTPLTQPFGTITFDYEQDLFILTLSAPSTRSDFEAWLQANYPALPLSEFIVR